MGVKAENIFTYLTGVHPNALAVNSTGAATQDGSEFIAEYMNNFILGPWQALFNYASITPNGVTESAAASQWLTCIEKGYAVGPGKLVCSFLNTTPAVSGDRILLLQGQGIVIANYTALDAATYVGDGNNATEAAGGGKFYRSSDSGGATPNIAGPYLQLPEGRGYALRGLDLAASVDPLGASRFLGDNQVDAFQGHRFYMGLGQSIGQTMDIYGTTTNDVPSLAGQYPQNISGPPSEQPITSLPKTDWVNGTPRIDSETRMSNLSIQFGITY